MRNLPCLFCHSLWVFALTVCLVGSIPSRSEAQTLLATATLNPGGGTTWDYALSNLEPVNSNYWLTDFLLPVGAPIRDVASPLGWLVDTDLKSYVLWSNVEPFPYPNDIAPGVSVAGFSFESDATDSVSSEFTLASWNHATDDAGPTTMGSVLTPLQPAAVPEPSILATILGMALVGMGIVSRRKR